MIRTGLLASLAIAGLSGAAFAADLPSRKGPVLAPTVVESVRGVAKLHPQSYPSEIRQPGSGSDLASLKTRAERRGDKYIVNGQKTWTTLGQYGDWMFNLVRTSTEGKPQTGISFLLLDMKSPGVTVRPIKLLDGECEVNEVFFDNVEVPAENLIGEENKGWTYAKHLLSHERTNIADVNRAKRELERLKRIAKAEGVYEDQRFRDEIAKLEVDVVALEMLVLRVLSAEKSGKNPLDIAGLLKIKGSEIQQRYSELMMLAAGPFSLPFIEEAMEAGWQGDHEQSHHHCPHLTDLHDGERGNDEDDRHDGCCQEDELAAHLVGELADERQAQRHDDENRDRGHGRLDV